MSSGACDSAPACGSIDCSGEARSGVEESKGLPFEDLSCFAAPAVTVPVSSLGVRAVRRGNRIARISEETAAAISSQQVVIDLKSICKELVENALDAGATAIEVRLMDCGLGGVEVHDNGSGISEEDLDLLGCRHATSKIVSFEDVYSKLETLGFRGEAVASLCFVARVSLVTRSRSATFGTRVFFDSDGKQIAREGAAREVGTTVSVEDIFGRMPLRRRTLEQTKQRQLQDALALLQRIALLHATSCRIVFSNFDSRTGNRSTFLATKGTSSSLLEAALSVYGAKQLATCTELTLKSDEPGREWRLESVISRPPHGVRSASLQHFFVKRRAVDFPPLLQKLLNRKWKEVSSRGLFPVCLAFLELDASLVDINVRKDKQQVLLAVEREIAHALLEAVSKDLAPAVGSFEVEAAKKQRQLDMKALTLSQRPAASQQQHLAEQQQLSEQEEQQDCHQQAEQQETIQGVHPLQLCSFSEQCDFAEGTESQKNQSTEMPLSRQTLCTQGTPEGVEAHGLAGVPPSSAFSSPVGGQVLENQDESLNSAEPDKPQEQQQQEGAPIVSSSVLSLSENLQHLRPFAAMRKQRLSRCHYSCGADRQFVESPQLQQQQDAEQQEQEQQEMEQHGEDRQSLQLLRSRPAACSSHEEGTAAAFAICTGSHLSLAASSHELGHGATPAASEEADCLASQVLESAVGECLFDLDAVYCFHGNAMGLGAEEAQTETETQAASHEADCGNADPSLTLFGALPEFAPREEASSLEPVKSADFFMFEKDFFKDLTLVGQFNEGFIIAALGTARHALDGTMVKGHKSGGTQAWHSSNIVRRTEKVTSLFIVDQHASDEKRIFETLNMDFRPRMQPLISPLRLSLPAELLAAVETFSTYLRDNGFGYVLCGPSGPQLPLGCSQFGASQALILSQASYVSSDARADALQEASSLSITRTQQQRCQRLTGCAKEPDLGSEGQRGDSGFCDEDTEVVNEERQCFLIGVPVVEGRQLGASDFVEFVAALASDDQGKAMWKGTMPPAKAAATQLNSASHHRVLLYRPSRVWDILASKACRSAVMIGDALAPQRQISILRRMSGLQLPFNCPHGRPTMRHLVDLVAGGLQEEDNFSQQVLQTEHQPLVQEPTTSGFQGEEGSDLPFGQTVFRQKRSLLDARGPQFHKRKTRNYQDSEGAEDVQACPEGAIFCSMPVVSRKESFHEENTPPLFSDNEGTDGLPLKTMVEATVGQEGFQDENVEDGSCGLGALRLTFIG